MSRLDDYMESVHERTTPEPDPVQTLPAAEDPEPAEVDFQRIQNLTVEFVRMIQDNEHPYILLSTAVEIISLYRQEAGWRDVTQTALNGLFLLDGRTWEELAAEGYGATADTARETEEAVEHFYSNAASRLKLLRGKLDGTRTEVNKWITQLEEIRQTIATPEVIESIPQEMEQQQLNID